MPFQQAKQAKDLLGRGPLALSLFGVQRQMCDLFSLHCQAQMPFDERLHQQRQEVHGEESLDAAWIFEEHRCYFVDGFELLKALLDGGLSFVSLEDFSRGKVAVVGQ